MKRMKEFICAIVKFFLVISLSVVLGAPLGVPSQFFVAPALARENSASPRSSELLSLKLIDVNAYQARFELEYFYNNANGPRALLSAEIPLGNAKTGEQANLQGPPFPISSESNKTLLSVHRPPQGAAKLQTRIVKVAMKDASGKVMVEKSFDLQITWPSTDPFTVNSSDPKEIERVYRLCVETIDTGRDFNGAKRGLEQIVLMNPEYLLAYPELARIHMKTNWNQEGLGQAERALLAALRIDPKHANSLVLLGYVHAHQERYKEAEEELRRAESIGTPNIWLYANLGELYAMQDDKPRAIAAYRKAIEAPESLKTYERARADAYEKLLIVLTTEKRWIEIDQLHAQRVAKFPDNACYKAAHADFRLRRLGDYDGALAIGARALEQGCPDDARQALGLAYYTKWAVTLKSGMPAKEADQYFNRGQTLYAAIPSLLVALAGSEHTHAVIPELKRRGIEIDTPDRNGLSALGLSITSGEVSVAEVLIREGANVNKQLGPEGFTPLMLAASFGNKEFVTLLLRSGADRGAKTRFGMTAEMFAKQGGFDEIARMLAVGSGA